MTKIENALTGNGNLKTEVHRAITGQFADRIANSDLNLTQTPNGDFAVAIAEADGRTIFARVEFVVTLSDPFVEKTKKDNKKTKETVVVPNLF